MPEAAQGEQAQYLRDCQRNGERKVVGVSRQVFGLRKSGQAFPMDLSVGEVTGGGRVAFVGIVRDVSERVQADRQRERLIEELATINAEQAHFVHAASHDLREPIRMIGTFCNRLAKDYRDRLDERGAEYLSLVVSASEHMSRLLDDLVDFARLSNDAEQNSTFDSNAVVDRVVDSLSLAIERSHGEIRHGKLPEITANPNRFERLMQNLIINALKYVAADVRPLVNIDAAREGDHWRFSVTDNGIGIEPRHFGLIFEPFKRLHGRGRYDGTGLGLSICRKIVESFAGEISVRSSVGQGSTFSFTIPSVPDTKDLNTHDPR
jgi:light-regulated signal transduction histidine kinase (bacteriophytochrome)